MTSDSEMYEATARLRTIEAQRAVYLEMFGDALAEREGYRELKGMDAVHYYIVSKFNWLPSQVRAMNYEDLQFVLTEDMSGWTVPRELRDLFPDVD